MESDKADSRERNDQEEFLNGIEQGAGNVLSTFAKRARSRFWAVDLSLGFLQNEKLQKINLHNNPGIMKELQAIFIWRYVGILRESEGKLLRGEIGRQPFDGTIVLVFPDWKNGRRIGQSIRKALPEPPQGVNLVCITGKSDDTQLQTLSDRHTLGEQLELLNSLGFRITRRGPIHLPY